MLVIVFKHQTHALFHSFSPHKRICLPLKTFIHISTRRLALIRFLLWRLALLITNMGIQTSNHSIRLLNELNNNKQYGFVAVNFQIYHGHANILCLLMVVSIFQHISFSCVASIVVCRVWMRGRMENNKYCASLFIDRWTSQSFGFKSKSTRWNFRWKHFFTFYGFQQLSWSNWFKKRVKLMALLEKHEYFWVLISDENSTRVFCKLFLLI